MNYSSPFEIHSHPDHRPQENSDGNVINSDIDGGLLGARHSVSFNELFAGAILKFKGKVNARAGYPERAESVRDVVVEHIHTQREAIGREDTP